jgi:hypothetical protein
MTNIVVNIEIPDWLDEETARSEIIGAWHSRFFDVRRQYLEKRAMEDDGALLEWAQIRSGMKLPPVVRAAVYDEAAISRDQEMTTFYSRDSRRPIAMRGSVRVLAKKLFGRYPDQNSWPEKVILRYLRKEGFTSFDDNEMREKWSALRDGLKRLYPNFKRDAFWDNALESRCFVSGRELRPTPHQFAYLKKLDALRRKTERLERNMVRAA